MFHIKPRSINNISIDEDQEKTKFLKYYNDFVKSYYINFSVTTFDPEMIEV